MELIVLGNYGPFPAADGACSGFLLRDENTNILIDCGNGVMSRLQKYCKIEDLDAIMLSHLHKDHCSDMGVLKYAVQIKKNQKIMDKPIEVFCPATPEVEFNDFNIEGIFNTHIITDRMQINVKHFVITFYKTIHPVECYGMRIEKGGKVFAYSGDTVCSSNVIKLAESADLFLCEANATENLKSKSNVPHLSVKEACDIARKAGAKKLLLTHFYFEESRENYAKDAEGEFENIELSEELKVYKI
ncbi:MBL fold metallo-hydrolase [Clostridium sp. SYSU_GA19001]|uniref:MBL fold metallo-hydrolase n=1 Tax=Clostridium caldaquaticum TaxID=2940653 RepID=UPI0020772B07|nr:MBL fold metallo-hydrolase [Clostridium caldaquaticum]MCM8710686.1 MBL fold metallo-hydrolase [Clostridium caldaquaticum]